MKDKRVQEVYRTKINQETSRIKWHELQRFFASGATVLVTPELDLVEVAFQISEDNKEQVEHWLVEGKIGKVTDKQASTWYESDTEVWAVVVSPYVLIQELKNETNMSPNIQVGHNR
jgi:hypothetical protein